MPDSIYSYVNIEVVGAIASYKYYNILHNMIIIIIFISALAYNYSKLY